MTEMIKSETFTPNKMSSLKNKVFGYNFHLNVDSFTVHEEHSDKQGEFLA
jgi:hypothetical protein